MIDGFRPRRTTQETASVEGGPADASPRRPVTQEQQVAIDRVVAARDQADAAAATYRQAMLDARDSDVALERIADALGVSRQNVDTLIRKWRSQSAQ